MSSPTLETKVAELRAAIHECETQFYLPKHRRKLGDLPPAFWHSLGALVLAAVVVELPESDGKEITAVIGKVHRRLGAPGDFGYGTPCGDALRNLYDRHNEVCNVLKGRAPDDFGLPKKEAAAT